MQDPYIKLAFIGREFNPLWDTKAKKIIKYNLLSKEPLFINFNRKEHTFIIAKSGGGKSYLAGVFAEELIRTMENYATIILDPMGIFSTLKMPNKNQDELDAWNNQINEVKAEGLPNSEVWIPAGDKKMFLEDAYDREFALQAPQFSYGTLCYAFDLDPLEPQVNLYRKAQARLLRQQDNYLLSDLIAIVRGEGADMGFHTQTVEALVTKLDALLELGIINANGVNINDIVRNGHAAVFDLSMSSNYTARILVNFFAEQLLLLRKQITRLVTRAKVQETKIDKPPWYIPPTQLVIDEAHNFLPNNPILRKCIKEGRNCGLMVTAISQSPDLTRDVYANITHLFVGQLVYDDDILAVKSMLPFEKSPKEFRKMIKDLTPGSFWYYNIAEKREQCIRIRPRKTLHPASTELLDERRYFNGEADLLPMEVAPKPSIVKPQAPTVPQKSISGPAAGDSTNNKKLPPIPFSEDYPKLHEPKYTTIRRHDKEYQINQIRPILLKGKGIIHDARIIFKHSKTLPEIDTQFLLKDTNRSTRDAAIALLNSFYIKPILDSEKLTILGLVPLT